MTRCFRGLGRVLAGVWMVSSASLGFAQVQQTQELFRYQGKNYRIKDLSPARQGQLYRVERDHYNKVKSIVEQAIIDSALAAEAKKTGKDLDELRKERFTIAPLTDQDMKDWYEKNKARIPYPFEQVKGQISSFLVAEKQRELQTSMIKQLLDSKDTSLLVKEPAAPRFVIGTGNFPAKGAAPAKAKVTVVEFADYQCPHCARANQAFREVMKEFKGQVRLVFMDFPINPSGISRKIAEGGVCAQKQNKYWEFHDMAFDKQKSLSHASAESFAKELALDMKAFEACMKDEATKALVESAKKEGQRLGVEGTPAIFINGAQYYGQPDAEPIKQALREELAKATS